MDTAHSDTQRLNPAPRSHAVPDTNSVHPPRLPAELEQVIEHIGARYIADVQLLSDAFRRLHAAQVAQQEQQIRVLSQRVQTIERERIERQPLVDPGMIEVALVIAAVGFLLADREGASAWFAPWATFVFLVSGIAAFVLYFVYFFQWMERHPAKLGGEIFVFASHAAVLVTSVTIFGVALHALRVPGWIANALVYVGLVACALLFTKSILSERSSTPRRQRPGGSGKASTLTLLSFWVAVGSLLTWLLFRAFTPTFPA